MDVTARGCGRYVKSKCELVDPNDCLLHILTRRSRAPIDAINAASQDKRAISGACESFLCHICTGDSATGTDHRDKEVPATKISESMPQDRDVTVCSASPKATSAYWTHYSSSAA